MVAFKALIAAFVAAAGASSLQAEDAVFAALLKRQAPGTPSYNCHDNCGTFVPFSIPDLLLTSAIGTAITQSRQPNKCESDAFKTNYENCLICSGPDNYNIWRMYGNTLSAAGTSCGLKTEPVSGKQPDVGAAVRAGASPSGAASATPAPASGSAAPVPATTNLVPSSVSAVPSASGNATASFTAVRSRLLP
jgi:hypothetical protein